MSKSPNKSKQHENAEERPQLTRHEKAKAAAQAKRASKQKSKRGKAKVKAAEPAKGKGAGKQPKRAVDTHKSEAAGKGKRAGAKQARKPASAARAKRPEAPKQNPNSLCPVSALCGACQLIDTPYPEQLANKQAYIDKLFAGVIDGATEVRPILGMDDPFHYRNKVVSPFAPGRKIKDPGRRGPSHEILYGMYRAGSHELIPTAGCLIENKIGQRVVQAVLRIMNRHGIEPYNEDTGEGFLRHVVVRAGHESGEVLVTVVTNGEEFPGARNFARELVKAVPEVTTIVQNVNTRQTNIILGQKEQRLYGPGFILDELCGLSFRISSHSFYQVNSTQTEVLYRTAIGMAHLSGTETVFDAYCGTGTIGLVAAHGLPGEEGHAAKVIGVDNAPSSIADALGNATHNGIENAQFVCTDATDFIQRHAAGGNSIDVLFLDPPRSGSTPEFMDAAIQLQPERIVYISCNPETQVRDVKPLLAAGYHIDELQAVDMFPHTEHIECVLKLTRAES